MEMSICFRENRIFFLKIVYFSLSECPYAKFFFRPEKGKLLASQRETILQNFSAAQVNSFTTSGMVSMETRVVTAKMWEA